jgi:predicted Zn-dependent peptidase
MTTTKVAKSVLSNGVRVVSEAMPQALSASIGVWVENGSRYEEPHENGVSHFIEHLLFKGTKKRSAAQIAEEIDAVGGVLNAFTGKEYTCYYAKVLGEDVPLGLEILADIFLDSVFSPQDVDRERHVVLQEISQAEDTPDDLIHDLFNLNFWKGHALALPIFGSAATVGAIDREMMVSFMKERYRAGRVFIAASGQVDHGSLVESCERFFCGILGDGAPVATTPPQSHGIFVHHERPLEQVHICIGSPGVSYTHDLRYAGYVMNTALGGGMSSRLFQEVREKRGRVYTIHSFMSSYLDCGYFAVYAGTNAEWAAEVIEVTLSELGKVAREGLTPAELARAKSQLKGNLLLGLESTDSRMNRLAHNEIYFGGHVPIEEVSRRIERVNADQIVELASSLFKAEQMGVVLLGDLKGQKVSREVLSSLA